jgi:2-polyprenyl-6-methoxyphenol hydroxylase-like FAD-dependent oxidoreductase
MHTIIVGSGPVGMTAALLLARNGLEVTLVDRDPGPGADQAWHRVGVMQFDLPHGFRARCRAVLTRRLPDVFESLLAGGVVDDGDGMRSRRSTFERTLWARTSAEPGITRLTGHADAVVVESGTATGLVVDRQFIGADLVVDASGRAGRLSAPYRPDGHTSDCGVAYAARLYATHDGAGPRLPAGAPVLVREQDGFFCLLFVHDAGTFTILFVRASDDRELACLRHPQVFEAATRLLPDVGAWVDPGRSTPIDSVRAGAGLTNAYRAQSPRARRLLAVGDAVATTNPMGARGLSLGMESAAALADVVTTAPEEHWAELLEDWCTHTLECWYDDHVATDHVLVDRLHGAEPDPDGFITWNLVAAAATDRPDFMAVLGPFLAMEAPPASIDPLREEVRGMLRAGWRPAAPQGPSRSDLLAAATAARAA